MPSSVTTSNNIIVLAQHPPLQSQSRRLVPHHQIHISTNIAEHDLLNLSRACRRMEIFRRPCEPERLTVHADRWLLDTNELYDAVLEAVRCAKFNRGRFRTCNRRDHRKPRIGSQLNNKKDKRLHRYVRKKEETLYSQAAARNGKLDLLLLFRLLENGSGECNASCTAITTNSLLRPSKKNIGADMRVRLQQQDARVILNAEP
jgi:hypothetical protein